MARFYRPERRNRNQGTSRRGLGQDNRMVIPDPDQLGFYERLGPYRKVCRTIQGLEITFVVEQTRPGCVHACTIDDMARVLQRMPLDRIGDLRLLILRQPNRKEALLSPVWGRLAYSYEFESDYPPAVIIEAIEPGAPMSRTLRQDSAGQVETQKLQNDGHCMQQTKRGFAWHLDLHACRKTQLFRTLPHELGHYVDYQEKVEQPQSELNRRIAKLDEQECAGNPASPEWDRLTDLRRQRWESLWKRYVRRPIGEREAFANRFAEQTIPTNPDFARLLDHASLKHDGLRSEDFSIVPPC